MDRLNAWVSLYVIHVDEEMKKQNFQSLVSTFATGGQILFSKNEAKGRVLLGKSISLEKYLYV